MTDENENKEAAAPAPDPDATALRKDAEENAVEMENVISRVRGEFEAAEEEGRNGNYANDDIAALLTALGEDLDL